MVIKVFWRLFHALGVELLLVEFGREDFACFLGIFFGDRQFDVHQFVLQGQHVGYRFIDQFAFHAAAFEQRLVDQRLSGCGEALDDNYFYLSMALVFIFGSLYS